MTSMAPLSVAGLMEFHVFETDPLMLLTYCIASTVEGKQLVQKALGKCVEFHNGWAREGSSTWRVE